MTVRGRARHKTDRDLPPELEAKIPPMQLGVVYEQRHPAFIIGALLATLSMYGPLSHNARSGFTFFVVPWIAPWTAALGCLLIPYNPYRFASFAGKLVGLDTRDPDARRLVAIFRPKRSYQYLAGIALKLSLAMFLMMILIDTITRQPLDWHTPADRFFSAGVGSTIGSYLMISSLHVAWGLRKWVNEYHQILRRQGD